MTVPSIDVSGTWWRHVPADADVYYRAPDPADNRWQRGTTIDAWYFADHPDTVWSEWYRGLAARGLPPQHGVPRDLWRWNVSLAGVADLAAERTRTELGLPALRPTSSQWPAFQQVGEALYGTGAPALVSPSAARPEGQVLCVFRPSEKVEGVEAIPPPETIAEPPVVPSGMRT